MFRLKRNEKINAIDSQSSQALIFSARTERLETSNAIQSPVRCLAVW
jgi:hypothetical protein